MTTREAFANAIARLPDYRRAIAWRYVGQLEHLIRELDDNPYGLSAVERDLLHKIRMLAP